MNLNLKTPRSVVLQNSFFVKSEKAKQEKLVRSFEASSWWKVAKPPVQESDGMLEFLPPPQWVCEFHIHNIMLLQIE